MTQDKRNVMVDALTIAMQSMSPERGQWKAFDALRREMMKASGAK